VEGSARWPEIAGMIIGQLLILSILLIARRNGRTEELAAAKPDPDPSTSTFEPGRALRPGLPVSGAFHAGANAQRP